MWGQSKWEENKDQKWRSCPGTLLLNSCSPSLKRTKRWPLCESTGSLTAPTSVTHSTEVHSWLFFWDSTWPKLLRIPEFCREEQSHPNFKLNQIKKKVFQLFIDQTVLKCVPNYINRFTFVGMCCIFMQKPRFLLWKHDWVKDLNLHGFTLLLHLKFIIIKIIWEIHTFAFNSAIKLGSLLDTPNFS